MCNLIDVDLGNTRFKWRYADRPSSVFIADSLDAVPEEWKKKGVSFRVRISSVLSEGESARFVSAVRASGFEVNFARVQQAAFGVNTLYECPERLGVDRWLALVASRQYFPNNNCVIIHCGTALVVDYLRSDGLHFGGGIVMGVLSSLRSLNQSASKINVTDFHGFCDVPGVNTQLGVAHGMHLLFKGFLKEVVLEGGRVLGDFQMLITGGDAEYFHALFAECMRESEGGGRIVCSVCSSLVMDGLGIVFP